MCCGQHVQATATCGTAHRPAASTAAQSRRWPRSQRSACTSTAPEGQGAASPPSDSRGSAPLSMSSAESTSPPSAARALTCLPIPTPSFKLKHSLSATGTCGTLAQHSPAT
eukprot:scaffold186696_cov32-Tisochrysis_lutea.AAC.1